jgi:hypothetical protein
MQRKRSILRGGTRDEDARGKTVVRQHDHQNLGTPLTPMAGGEGRKGPPSDVPSTAVGDIFPEGDDESGAKDEKLQEEELLFHFVENTLVLMR